VSARSPGGAEPPHAAFAEALHRNILKDRARPSDRELAAIVAAAPPLRMRAKKKPSCACANCAASPKAMFTGIGKGLARKPCLGRKALVARAKQPSAAPAKAVSRKKSAPRQNAPLTAKDLPDVENRLRNLTRWYGATKARALLGLP